jgi:hypothetical protein
MQDMLHRHRHLGRTAATMVVALLAVCAVVGVGSAAAATQHWAAATATEGIPAGGIQTVEGKNIGNLVMHWKYEGASNTIECSKQTISGTVENPAAGGAGVLGGSATTELTGCTINVSSCKISGAAIKSRSLKGYAFVEAGENRVRIEPLIGSTVAVVKFENSGAEVCTLPSSISLTGYIEAYAKGSVGHYSTYSSPTHLAMGGGELGIDGEFSLSNPSGKPLGLSTQGPLGLASESTPGVPHWMLGVPAWTPIPSAQKFSYFSSAVPLTLNFKVALTNVEISGCEALFAGSVENPAGGGAGTISSVLTPGYAHGCKINVPTCSINYSESVQLQGSATEVGAVPAVEWTGSGGKVMRFQLNPAGGAEKCAIGTEVKVTGKLIATSESSGNLKVGASELLVGTQKATISNSVFALEGQNGGNLRLQP